MGTTLRNPRDRKHDRNAKAKHEAKAVVSSKTYTVKEYVSLAKEYEPEYINGYTYAF